ncbi:peptide ABC transporter ATP-binding protein [Weissella viridescens]|uniref:Peptide ABC transporter ATPase n=1 Tax=Weissella viridescens TaxID=1629 RepID=A0A0R2H2F4_WEIVI|nr:ABC transporter ATP-binding protein [Weissella viridescens]KRN46994.1 peptide ABC transporter ATPase [Weissella viridescens]GEA94339.1 peptide ABC transporter ATP-binding protein [Weissella viridescens]
MTTLALKHINKTFGSGQNKVYALKDVSFETAPGDLTLILGPSGSGKSTLLTILGGLQTPTTGDMVVNNQNIKKLTQHQRETFRLNEIGFVLQSYNLVPYLTVSDQFTLVDHVKKQDNLDDADFEQVIKQLGIEKLLHQYPSELSGGQAQRVAIARALYANPSIILADEPTAALDSDRVIQVGQLLQSIAHQQNKSVVTVTHDIRLKEFADHIYELVDGELTQVK